MAKAKFFIDLTKPIPEWGLSEAMSTAVPIATSGVEIKSTRGISSGMHTSIRTKIDAETLKKARTFVVNAKKGTVKIAFKSRNRASRSVVLARKVR